MDSAKLDNELRSLLDRFRLHRLPCWNDLPDIDLYMDQVIAFMHRYIGVVSGDADKILTPAMVNNYVKQKIMPAPVKKKYSRAHLAYLTVICVLKQELPIASVQEVITNLLQTYTEREMLDYFAAFYKERWDSAVARVSEELQPTAGTDADFKTRITQQILEYAVESHAERVIAEHLLQVIADPVKQDPANDKAAQKKKDQK